MAPNLWLPNTKTHYWPVNFLEPKTSINFPFPSGRGLLGIKVDILFLYLKHHERKIIITQCRSIFHHALPYFRLCTLVLGRSSHERVSRSAHNPPKH